MLQCYNRGCGQLFDEAANNEESCRHHPGEPFFHDAYKGWSCCNKKSVDFTEFLNIKGCTLAKHSNVKPPEPEKSTKDDNNGDKDEVIEVRAPIREAMSRPPIETPFTVLQPTVAAALKETIDNLKVDSAPAAAASPFGEASDAIAVGTSCKNNGCSYSFTGTDSHHSQCAHHPGVPIFHEGMKFWSCCQKRTSDFAQFMAQKGCVNGQHKWVKENEDKKVVQCRYDWHQTATNVVVAIYAKKYHYAQSLIEINPIRLHVKLIFPEQENAAFDIDLELGGIVNVQKASAHMYGTKVEITLPKLEPGSWSKLNFKRATMPATKKTNATEAPKNDESDEEFFDLDDIEPVYTHGLKLSDMSLQNPNNLD
ncbi:cysteine and histidine-rich domain-containing protein [Drosophila guanche]|uniref:Blast:Cysteine and histidine-rich domain-containing protein n=1 Tax=Drosophila guanche TaxID=7266 RepID=A0A3B0JQM8_DROGU|nr:cysteine and histidine-rich domain-containing protein [Drosophila guanche]SPP82692.1 blast:Cysteine and histidine-rich domain-containing protein [Drosophila guanche]